MERCAELRLVVFVGLCLAFGGGPAAAGANADLRIAVVGADRSDPAHAAFVAGVRAAAAVARAEFSIETSVRDWTARAMTAEAQERVLREVIGAGYEGLVIVPHAELRWELFADVVELAGGAVAWAGTGRAGANDAFRREAARRLAQTMEGLGADVAIRRSPYFAADIPETAERGEVAGTVAVGVNPAWEPVLRAGDLPAVVQPDVFGAGFDAVRALGMALGEPRMEFLPREETPLVFTPEDADAFAALWLDWLK